MQGAGAKALELVILTAARTSEVLNAKWVEFDLDNAVWTIPKERMKSFREHRIPLSESVMRILNGLSHQSDYLFPGAKRSRKNGVASSELVPLSNMACIETLRRMGRGDLTVHGFRSTFRDWISETTIYPRDVAEMALAHAVEDKSEAAYRRGDLIEKRRSLMQDWATYCNSGSQCAGVVAIRSKAAA